MPADVRKSSERVRTGDRPPVRSYMTTRFCGDILIMSLPVSGTIARGVGTAVASALQRRCYRWPAAAASNY